MSIPRFFAEAHETGLIKHGIDWVFRTGGAYLKLVK